MQGTSADVRERCFAAIGSELDRLQRMKQEIVEFARGESSLDEGDVRIDSFLENTISALRPQLAERGVTLTVTHGYKGTWYIDSYRLARVIENLVRNAAAAISESGSIAIRSRASDDALVIDVEDDGWGIPAEMIEEIFEPFVSYRKKEGTGLGLAIARNVVQQHHGTISVTSSAAGTCFTIELPRRTDMNPTEEAP
jgi:two-component system sporulation sensor kinase A